MATGRDRSRPPSAENLIERLERAFELERIVGRDLANDPGPVEPASLLERLSTRPKKMASPEGHGAHDITNLLQEAMEEEGPDKRLTQTVVALGLLLASLNSPTTT